MIKYIENYKIKMVWINYVKQCKYKQINLNIKIMQVILLWQFYKKNKILKIMYKNLKIN